MNQETTLPASQKQETKALSMGSALSDIGITAQDLVIPSLMLMQNTSEYVGDGKAKLGDIINSQTLEVLGGVGVPVEILPLKLTKTIRIYDISTGQPKFIRMEALTDANLNLPWEDIENGVPIKRVTCFNFYVLLASECLSGEAFPCVVTFKGTSINAGKQLATQMFKMQMFKKASYSQTILLSTKKEKKDTNTYAVLECLKGNSAPTEFQESASMWLSALANNRHSVDDKEVSSKKSTPVDEDIPF